MMTTLAAVAILATTYRVNPGESIQAAVGAAMRSPDATNEVVLAAGRHYLKQTLEIADCPRALIIRGEGAGKTIVSGADRVDGWQQEGEFWFAEVPDVKTGKWQPRTLIVNGRMAARACFPGGGKFLQHQGGWKLPLLPATSGFWARKPTVAECSVVPFKREQLPAGIDLNNAEAHLYFDWDDSYSPIVSNDMARGEFYLAKPSPWPIGAFKRYNYELFNVREGMTERGRWYVDYKRGRFYYWPLANEDMTCAEVYVPRVLRVFAISNFAKGSAILPAVTLRDMSVTGTDLKSGYPGFAGMDMDGAVHAWRRTNANATPLHLENLEIYGVAGCGVQIYNGRRAIIRSLYVHDVGAMGIRYNGNDAILADNRIERTGRVISCGGGLDARGNHNLVRGNYLKDLPYCAILGRNVGSIFENNVVDGAMSQMNDGAAFYLVGDGTIVRNNFASNIVSRTGKYGVHAYYFDEGSVNCLIISNVAYNVSGAPIHNHMSRNIRVIDNIIESPTGKKMTISFQRSTGNCVFSGNRLRTSGEVVYGDPDGIRVCENNVIERPDGTVVPSERKPVQRKQQRIWCCHPRPANAAKLVADGAVTPDEWHFWWTMDRTAENYHQGGAASQFACDWDGEALYIAIKCSYMPQDNPVAGTEWAKSDAVRLTIGGKVITAYLVDRKLVADFEIAPVDCYIGRLKSGGKLYGVELRIPFAALGITPKADMTVPFVAVGYSGQFDEYRYLEGEISKPELKFCAK